VFCAIDANTSKKGGGSPQANNVENVSLWVNPDDSESALRLISEEGCKATISCLSSFITSAHPKTQSVPDLTTTRASQPAPRFQRSAHPADIRRDPKSLPANAKLPGPRHSA
jgi:hypothetical protein